MQKRVAVSLAVLVAAAGLSVGAVATVGGSASAAKCAAANGSNGDSGSAGGAGGTGGVRCPKGGTTIFTDDFLQESTGDCRTTLTNWNLTGSASPANVD